MVTEIASRGAPDERMPTPDGNRAWHPGDANPLTFRFNPAYPEMEGQDILPGLSLMPLNSHICTSSLSVISFPSSPFFLLC